MWSAFCEEGHIVFHHKERIWTEEFFKTVSQEEYLNPKREGSDMSMENIT